MTLFWQQFKAQFAGLLIWLAGGVALVALTVQTAPSFLQNDMLTKYVETLPESMLNMMGLEPGMSPVDAFVSSQVSKTLVLIVTLYAVMLALNAITREIDRRTIDFLLSLPVRRSEVLLARAAVMLVNTGLITAAMALTFRIGFSSQGLEGNWGAYNLIFLNVWLLAAALGGSALLVSLWIDDYGLGVKAMLGLVSVGYFLEFVFRAVEMSRTARLLSPFSYVDANTILKNGSLPLLDTLVLVGVAVVTIGLSLPFFERKQITT